MKAWRSGASSAKIRAHATSSSRANAEVAGQPDQREQDDVATPATSRASCGAGTAGGPAVTDEAADDLGAGDDRRRQAGDAVRGRIAVQLQEVRLERVERVDPDPDGERRGEHQPADGRIAQAAVDRAL